MRHVGVEDTGRDSGPMARMSLSDGDVAALAREAVDRRDPELEIRIEPADPVDPYRWETAAWTVHAGVLEQLHRRRRMTAQEALEKLVRRPGAP